MAEQTFRSPGFFEREIDLSQRESEIVGTPAGIAGTAQMGPAFVPVTVGSFADFERRFGTLDPDQFGPYAVREFLKHRTAVTYVRVLGAGANSTSTDISNTMAGGIVKGAGFKLAHATVGETAVSGQVFGAVQFLVGRHEVSGTNTVAGYNSFVENNSYDITTPYTADTNNQVNLIRAMLFTTTGSRFQIFSGLSASFSLAGGSQIVPDFAYTDSSARFKLVLSSTAGTAFASDEGHAGVRIYTASFDPDDDAYIGKVLNTDPNQFQKEQHLLYADFPVEKQIAELATRANTARLGGSGPTVGIVSGTVNSSPASGISGINYRAAFGRFDTRYQGARTTSFISQPYGDKEFDLFKLECISDGEVANQKFKASISNIRKSSDPFDPYCSFTVEIRSFEDSDKSPQVLEQYSDCNLNPNDESYIARKIGDMKAFYNFDAELESERKLLVGGKYPNISSRVRVVMSTEIESGEVPKDAIPFGFRGFSALKTNDTLTDRPTGSLSYDGTKIGSEAQLRLTYDRKGLGYGGAGGSRGVNRASRLLTGSILPPVPLRYKATMGAMNVTAPAYRGEPGSDERVDARLYWGAKFDRLPKYDINDMPKPYEKSNASSVVNNLFRSYSKFLGIQGLDNLVTGSGADNFNNNKFTLARVALSNRVANDSTANPNLDVTANTVITGTAKEHILESAYIRNGISAKGTYTIPDPIDDSRHRVTFASLAAMTSSVYFNRFSNFAKFTNFFYGGFDGLNDLDSDMKTMNDRASSSDTGGLAGTDTHDIGLSSLNNFGTGKNNAIVSSYRTAASILTDPDASRANIIAMPGIRDSAITDFVQERLANYSKGFYVIDTPAYDSDSNRLFRNSANAPSISKTSETFDGRSINNNFTAAYFPDVTIEDPINNRPVKVPASVAVLGALGYNDNVAYPWFAPAGFNRAALDFVTSVNVRLNNQDRNDLYDARINPIATFPSQGFVIWGQKTLQLKKSALDRVNVRRMLLEVKRQVVEVAERIVFEANTPATRARFVSQVTPKLALIQSQQGIDQFKVVMDTSNNSQDDVENNILNGRIVMVPTRAVEFIAIDFIITHSGVSFE